MTRSRALFSVRRSLIAKASEAALTAVQAYNNPLTTFKSESFIVLMTVAWTYLLHAEYRQQGVEYRYFDMHGSRRWFRRNADGTHRYWDLMECLYEASCPLDPATKANLPFLHGLRNEIEHHMPPALDDDLASRFSPAPSTSSIGSRPSSVSATRFADQRIHSRVRNAVACRGFRVGALRAVAAIRARGRREAWTSGSSHSIPGT